MIDIKRLESLLDTERKYNLLIGQIEEAEQKRVNEHERKLALYVKENESNLLKVVYPGAKVRSVGSQDGVIYELFQVISNNSSLRHEDYKSGQLALGYDISRALNRFLPDYLIETSEPVISIMEGEYPDFVKEALNESVTNRLDNYYAKNKLHSDNFKKKESRINEEQGELTKAQSKFDNEESQLKLEQKAFSSSKEQLAKDEYAKFKGAHEKLKEENNSLALLSIDVNIMNNEIIGKVSKIIGKFNATYLRIVEGEHRINTTKGKKLTAAFLYSEFDAILSDILFEIPSYIHQSDPSNLLKNLDKFRYDNNAVIGEVIKHIASFKIPQLESKEDLLIEAMSATSDKPLDGFDLHFSSSDPVSSFANLGKIKHGYIYAYYHKSRKTVFRTVFLNGTYSFIKHGKQIATATHGCSSLPDLLRRHYQRGHKMYELKVFKTLDEYKHWI